MNTVKITIAIAALTLCLLCAIAIAAGWRLPDTADWNALAQVAGGGDEVPDLREKLEVRVV